MNGAVYMPARKPPTNGDGPPPPPRPLIDLARERMEVEDLTVRALSRATREHDARGRGLTHSYLAAVMRGDEWPSYEAVELIAATLAVPLREVAEARLADLRRQLDPKA